MANYSFNLRNQYKPETDEVKKQIRKTTDAKTKKRLFESILSLEQVPVRLTINFGSTKSSGQTHRFHCKTDFSVYPKQWDFEKQQMKQQVGGSMDFNKKLNKLKEDVNDYYNELMKRKEKPTFEQVRELIQIYISTKVKPRFTDNEKSFFQVYDEYLNLKSKDLHPRTIQKFRTTKTALEKFTAIYYKKHFDFDKIDLLFFDKFKHYLQFEAYNQKSKEEKKENKKGFRNDTVSKFIENFKNFLKWSYDRKFHKNLIFQHSDFKVERDKNLDIVTMTIHELKRFYELDLSKKPMLERVRDMYCFQTFTGQRFSDVASFRKEDLHGDTWIFEAYKTKKTTVIPLVGYAAPALDILKKYNYKLPIISNQKFNDFLKLAAKEEKAELTRMVEINRYQGNKKQTYTKLLNEVISSHMARRTAVSILLNIYNMPVNQVMEITGHVDYKTLKRYIDTDKEALRTNLEQTRSVTELMKVVKAV